MKRSGWWFAVGASVALLAAGAARAAQVEVVLSPALGDAVQRIDQVERRDEATFRAHRAYDEFGTSARSVSSDSVFSRVEWANEVLIPDLGQYGVENLVKALVNESLRRAGITGYDKTIRITLDELGVTNHAVARLRSGSNFASGKIEEVDPSTGAVLRSSDVVANTVVSPTADRSYKGPNYAFDDTDPNRRVGPTIAYFVSKGLGRLFPDRDFPTVVTPLFGDQASTDLPRPRLVRVR
jgi:hypothetical protein